MSELTYLNRWQRYQLARLQGLIDGLKTEARRLRGRDFEPAIDHLGEADGQRPGEDGVRVDWQVGPVLLH